MTLKTWRIKQCGWPTYFKEVQELALGRNDVKVIAHQPGILALVETEREPEVVRNLIVLELEAE